MASIDDAIAAAKQAAQTVSPSIVPAASQQANVPATQPGRRLTMDDLGAGSIDVSNWLQVDEFGLRIDKSAEHLEELDVEIDLDEVVPVYMVRFGKNPANYRKTYDGVTTFGSTKPWEVTLREAQSIDSDCKGQYSSVEVPMTLIGDVELKKDRKRIDDGARLGYTPSVTGFRYFDRFFKDCRKAGKTGIVKAKVGFETRKSNGNTWGVVTFIVVETN